MSVDTRAQALGALMVCPVIVALCRAAFATPQGHRCNEVRAMRKAADGGRVRFLQSSLLPLVLFWRYANVHDVLRIEALKLCPPLRQLQYDADSGSLRNVQLGVQQLPSSWDHTVPGLLRGDGDRVERVTEGCQCANAGPTPSSHGYSEQYSQR